MNAEEHLIKTMKYGNGYVQMRLEVADMTPEQKEKIIRAAILVAFMHDSAEILPADENDKEADDALTWLSDAVTACEVRLPAYEPPERL